MKKVLKWIIIIVIILGCSFAGVYYYKNNENSNKLKDKIKTASEDYFNKYVSANDSKNIYEITLEELQNSNEEYDLKGLENCDSKKTYSSITINYKTGKPKKTDVNLKCG